MKEVALLGFQGLILKYKSTLLSLVIKQKAIFKDYLGSLRPIRYFFKRKYLTKLMEKSLTKSILAGKIFIYPTDTIYGIGCDATNKKSVDKIKQIKERDASKPLAVIAPSLDWINENLVVDCDLSKYLPGQYTLLLKKKNPKFLSHVSSNDRLGVRIPAHEFTEVIQGARVPFITTSVNLSGDPFITKIPDVPTDILEHVDHVIDYGELNGTPSTLILDGKEIKR